LANQSPVLVRIFNFMRPCGLTFLQEYLQSFTNLRASATVNATMPLWYKLDMTQLTLCCCEAVLIF